MREQSQGYETELARLREERSQQVEELARLQLEAGTLESQADARRKQLRLVLRWIDAMRVRWVRGELPRATWHQRLPSSGGPGRRGDTKSTTCNGALLCTQKRGSGLGAEVKLPTLVCCV